MSNNDGQTQLQRDLEIFANNDGTTTNTVFTKLDKTITSFGSTHLRSLLSDYTDNIDELKERQYNVLKIQSDPTLIESGLKTIHKNEANILELWQEITDEMQAFHDIVYFNFPFEFANQICNRNETLLQCSNLYNIWLAPLFNVAIPLLTVIVPYTLYFVAKYILRYDIPTIPITTFVKFIFSYMLSSYIGNGIISNTKLALVAGIIVWLAFYCINSYQSIKSSYDTHKNINMIHSKVNSIKEVIMVADRFHSQFPDQDAKPEIDYFKELLHDEIFETEPHLLSNKGKVLLAYHLLTQEETKTRLWIVLKYLGRIDAYYSIAKLVIDDGYTFANYLTKRERPALYALSVWHPAIEKEKVVYNNVMMRDGKGGKQMITGPNKAGKSTYIKSVAVAVLLAQTLGVVNSKRMYLTPYKNINTHLHIPDKTGYESLFEAELKRASNELRNLQSGDFTLVIMDEILTSTNYVEGYAAAYAIAKKMAEYSNANIMITTHYTGLTKLADEKKFRNYYFDLKQNKEGGDIKYNYRLKQGISKQFIALELLGKEFETEKDIIRDANRIAQDIRSNK